MTINVVDVATKDGYRCPTPVAAIKYAMTSWTIPARLSSRAVSYLQGRARRPARIQVRATIAPEPEFRVDLFASAE